MRTKLVIASVCTFLLGVTAVYAKDIPYRNTVKLKVGQSVILKGVRADCEDKSAPSFSALRRLPKPKLGTLADGGAGTVMSKACKKRVPARAILYKAKKPGKERLTIYSDWVIITVD